MILCIRGQLILGISLIQIKEYKLFRVDYLTESILLYLLKF